MDIVIRDAGFPDVDVFVDALADDPDNPKLARVRTELAIVHGASEPLTMARVLDQYLADKARGRDTSARDWQKFEKERRRVVRDFGNDKIITDLRRADARAYVAKLQADGYKPASQRKIINFLSALCSWSVRELELTGWTNPFSRLAVAKVDAAAVDVEDGRGFTHDEVKLILANVHRLNPELRTIILVVSCTGLRISEAAGVLVRDWNPDDRTITVRPNETRRIKGAPSRRTVPVVSLEAVTALNAMAAGKQDGDALSGRYGRPGGGEAASATFIRLTSRLGLSAGAHGLRHHLRDSLREVGCERDTALSIMGHSGGDVDFQYGSRELIEAKRSALERCWRLVSTAAG